MKRNTEEFLEWIQNWFKEHCDSDWEHSEIIKIYTIDNPGWRLVINLEGTNCENKIFEEINKEISKDNWYQCFLRNGKFEGAGGPYNLTDLLSIFIKWAKNCEQKI